MKSIWMIDSDRVQLAGAGIALKNMNLETRLFADPFEFLRQLATAELPNMIVIERRLAGVDMLDILRVLSSHPAYAHIPRVVIFGGAETEAQRAQVMMAGATEVVRRDLSAKIFCAVVRIRLSESAGMSVSQFSRCVKLKVA